MIVLPMTGGERREDVARKEKQLDVVSIVIEL